MIQLPERYEVVGLPEMECIELATNDMIFAESGAFGRYTGLFWENDLVVENDGDYFLINFDDIDVLTTIQFMH